jgi:hypothetical protein
MRLGGVKRQVFVIQQGYEVTWLAHGIATASSYGLKQWSFNHTNSSLSLMVLMSKQCLYSSHIIVSICLRMRVCKFISVLISCNASWCVTWSPTCESCLNFVIWGWFIIHLYVPVFVSQRLSVLTWLCHRCLWKCDFYIFAWLSRKILFLRNSWFIITHIIFRAFSAMQI